MYIVDFYSQLEGYDPYIGTSEYVFENKGLAEYYLDKMGYRYSINSTEANPYWENEYLWAKIIEVKGYNIDSQLEEQYQV